ncbi:hypothetical protein K469DRAFT_181525 [Zopfia rhizophila CBS 207.26]|uniref:DUF7918 domain-containing protein n=1 Tax=Zopfia rhizophila CBS 207.26 TaxID=1314779 RepID=A0A6A6DXC7_9PEZI|nr:hypothetical protein K469DRAFT_181525 [Zopfia rhizophila CBS 207.26]
MGKIKLEFYYIITLAELQISNRSRVDIPELGAVSEKVIKGKALSHQASLREPESIPKVKFWDFRYLHPMGVPFATFKFKYRSRDVRRALCIIPRSLSPVRPEQKQEQEMTREELEEYVRRHRERETAGLTVKQEFK